jgi:putative DNA primase/helicase
VTAAEVAFRLHGRKSGRGFVANCPAHDDWEPSLSLNDGDDGRLLVRCHAGCEQRAVIAALKELGLWPERKKLADQGIVAEYNYTDEQGTLLYQVVRFAPKTFRPRRPDGAGGWVWGYGKVRRVPYRLRELIEAAVVFIPEGERDCEALRDHGFACTTNPGGANGWRPEFNQYFSGKEAIILPDADAPGWQRALDIARGIVCIAASVQMLELPGAKDAAEWFERGHSELELIALVEEGGKACHQ